MSKKGITVFYKVEFEGKVGEPSAGTGLPDSEENPYEKFLFIK